ncbi:threonyl-tRNA synthetase [Mortierella polycephala]|uniref:Threonyl-tRNA synthetase n=1 Tax=Mortierella polycephala TaxID=41804 RepID=A0A9P6QH54_9FUNG|nr:threonyl-tRNA synthetase [Mortierella polycephala]
MSVPTMLSVSELKSKLGDTVVLDGSWHMPAMKRDPIAEFKEIGHIPGARYFDIESIKDKSSSLPHMMPSAEQFAAQVGELGISNDDHVVVYDTIGFFSAPRVYWMFKAFGHNKVSVLDGGFKAWKAAGYPIEYGEANIEPKTFKTGNLNKSLIRNYDQILQIAKDQDGNQHITIVDARSNDRFSGAAPEPRKGLSSGHMPGAKNVSFKELFDSESGKLHSNEQIRKTFHDAGVDVNQLTTSGSSGQPGKDREVIMSCGSGVSACVLYFALERLGVKNLAVYDGSWSEYASRPESIIVKD